MTDDLDRSIVDLLIEDGRRPFVKIAEELGVSEATVRQRVARLTADGVMQITAVTNPLKLGYEVVSMVGLRVDPSQRDAVGAALAACDEITYLIACTGRFDYLAEVTCRGSSHMLEFLGGRLAAVTGIRETESFGYLSVLKESYKGP